MSKNRDGKAWAFVPARGGSKSIPLKNLADLGGRPLMDYCVVAAKHSDCFERIVCSTDHPLIEERAIRLGIECDQRPAELGGDQVSTKAVMIEFLKRAQVALPEFVFIVEPTSPFLRPADIVRLRDKMRGDPSAVSGQTITKPPHTHHAWNQRIFSDGYVRFMFEERKKVFAKQNKPTLYIFGNVVACRTQALLDGHDVFGEPSVGVEIEWPYDVNIDSPDDLRLANALITANVVSLTHMADTP